MTEQRNLFRKRRPSRPPNGEELIWLKSFCNEVQFIIQVVGENEYQAAVTRMQSPETTHFKKPVTFPRPNIVVGMFADKKTALVFTGEGSNCSDYVQDAIKAFPNAQFVIGIGVCYAFSREAHKLGDVLVSKQICDLKNLKFKNKELVDCGQRIDVVMDLMKVFCMNRTLEEDFEVSDKERYSNISAGQFASLPSHVQSQEVCDMIHNSLPEAIGGDMEGGELLKFQIKRNIEGVIVIKGVTHYADGNLGEDWEFTASMAALNYAESKLQDYSGKII